MRVHELAKTLGLTSKALLEKLKVQNSLLVVLKKNIGNEETYVALDPGRASRTGKINKDWKIIVNR